MVCSKLLSIAYEFQFVMNCSFFLKKLGLVTIKIILIVNFSKIND